MRRRDFIRAVLAGAAVPSALVGTVAVVVDNTWPVRDQTWVAGPRGYPVVFGKPLIGVDHAIGPSTPVVMMYTDGVWHALPADSVRWQP